MWFKIFLYTFRYMFTGVDPNTLNPFKWLTYVQENDLRLINKSGNREKLHHKYFRGEKSIAGWEVDGYAKVDGKAFIFEFNGCFHHKGCPHCGDSSEKDERFERKISELREFGTIIVMWECIWKKKVKSLNNPRTASFPDILNFSAKESRLLNLIKSNAVFGFIHCNVRNRIKILVLNLKFQRFFFRLLILN